ncbi:MAG: rhodanese-like domain-containing protein [Treponema sp.]
MRIKKIFLSLGLLFFVSCSKIVYVEDISGTRMVKINTSKEKDKHLILDVRPYHIYKEGHLEYAINIPKSDLERRIVEIMDLKHLPIYVYGKNADSSFPATKILVQHGFQNIYNAEGIDEYNYTLVSFDTIRIYEVRHNINSDNFFLIDYRTKTSYNAEHFKDAINIPIGEIPNNINLLPKDKNRPIVIYCNTGITSTWGAKELVEMGYKNVSAVLEGAIAENFIREMDKENAIDD